MSLPSMSKHGRAMACPASEALPHEEQPTSQWADDGNAKHDVLARVVRGDEMVAEALASWVEGVKESGALEVLHSYVAEVALAYDVAFGIGRLIGANIGRNYGPLGLTEVAGAADYLYVDGEAQTVRVVDLKTGRVEVAAKDNAQLLTLALAACRYYGMERAEVAILWAPEGMTPRWDWWHVSAERLAQHAAELAIALLQQVAEARADVEAGRPVRHVQSGAHCRYCPAQAACPERSAIAVQATTAPTFRQSWQAALAAGQTAQVYAMAKTLEGEAEVMMQEVRALALKAPVDIGDGRTLVHRTTQRQSIDAATAWPVLTRLLGEEAARAAVVMEVSKASVERGVKAAKAAGTLTGSIKAGVEQVMRETTEAGAVQLKQVERYEESK